MNKSRGVCTDVSNTGSRAVAKDHPIDLWSTNRSVCRVIYEALTSFNGRFRSPEILLLNSKSDFLLDSLKVEVDDLGGFLARIDWALAAAGLSGKVRKMQDEIKVQYSFESDIYEIAIGLCIGDPQDDAELRVDQSGLALWGTKIDILASELLQKLKKIIRLMR